MRHIHQTQHILIQVLHVRLVRILIKSLDRRTPLIVWFIRHVLTRPRKTVHVKDAQALRKRVGGGVEVGFDEGCEVGISGDLRIGVDSADGEDLGAADGMACVCEAAAFGGVLNLDPVESGQG